MKRLILNADDFGLSPGVSRGILEAFTRGVLTSTTMLVNLEHFEDAVELARSHPDLPVGIHLSLLWGAPVSPADQVPTLVTDDGSFPRSLTTLARRYFTGQLDLDDVRRELTAQVDRFQGTGLVPTHADSHKHVHCLPGVMRVMAEVCSQHGITRVRLPIERRLSGLAGVLPRASWRSAAKCQIIRMLAHRHPRILSEHGLTTTDHFLGITHMSQLTVETLGAIFAALPDGVTELMCHPGHTDDAANLYSGRPPAREVELSGLCDPRTAELAREHSVEFISYLHL